eukprot:CAMPEP_0113442640 /NCGR_PEP_ID=MMETSP0014_2-20120614/1717_1 /TAXON_ID=2857 /ORGANISM="Nitzschia sp." /LENGTH=280 /DNA_ID=CAMNT_0000333551 /DNA_START=153 /DNA_END=992 /DNA_ORIENTATION=- /assembly_acc=CAM_ASM_000159
MAPSTAKEHPYEYLAGSAAAALVNFPLWRASAFAQSGFQAASAAAASSTSSAGSTTIAVLANNYPRMLSSPYVHAFLPPYKGAIGVVGGMTWARAAIFWGSDRGRDVLRQRGYDNSTSTIVPPLVCSTLVQIINQPIVRASISLQDPNSPIPNTVASIKHIYNTYGLKGLWHGTSAGIAKTIPKYCTAIVVKDWMEDHLPRPTRPSVSEVDADDESKDQTIGLTYRQKLLIRSAIKSAAAGVLGAALTNPFDVVRNEMFKTNMGFLTTVQRLYQTEKFDW